MAKHFEEAGFECVCCGHLFDLLFLQRLRSLIEIADATISNGVGSHIGYCVYLNKPHFLVPNEFKLIDVQGNEGEEEMLCKEKSKNYWDIYNAFSNNDDYYITDNQRQIVDRLWGISDMKKASDLQLLIETCYLLQKCHASSTRNKKIFSTNGLSLGSNINASSG